MGAIKEHSIVKNYKTKTVLIFEGLLDGTNFIDVEYDSPQEYIKKYWTAYKNKYPKANASLNGGIYELIIYTLFYREGLVPFYSQAKVTYVPNVIFDAILYNQNQPISISLNTSLRERYKQADLESIALKYVHRRAKCYLLTLEANEAAEANEKIKRGDIIGLDKVVDCNTKQINELIEELKQCKYEEAESKPAVEGFIIKKR